MSGYEQAWVQRAWEQVEKDFRDRRFLPRNEYDIQAHLYHSMFLLKQDYAPSLDLQLTLEWRDVDLAVVQAPSDQPSMLIEIKETHTAAGPVRGAREGIGKWFMDKLQGDIWKLKSLVGEFTLAKPFMVFLFRGAQQEGIQNDTLTVCSEFASEIANEGVTLLYGPKPLAEKKNTLTY